MAIVTPPVFTTIVDQEVTYTNPVTEETLRKMAQNINFFGQMAKIGSIRAVQLNQIGVAAPDSTIWQLCDGTEITSPTSPLRTVGLIQRFTPNFTGEMVRGAADESANNTGGSSVLALEHYHGGETGFTGGDSIGEEGTERSTRQNHSHPIFQGLGNIPFSLAHQVVAFYIKIN